LADRVAVMYEGRIVEVGDTRQIFKDPQDPYTRALIESIPTIEERKAS
jgi:peptide/nickel transport system ATP-binding protein